MVTVSRQDYLIGQLEKVLAGTFYGQSVKEKAQEVSRLIEHGSGDEWIERKYMELQFAMIDELVYVESC